MTWCSSTPASELQLYRFGCREGRQMRRRAHKRRPATDTYAFAATAAAAPRRALLSAVQDSGSLHAAAEELADFLPPSCSLQDLLAGLQQLEDALQRPQQQHCYSWLRSPAAAADSLGHGGAAAAGQLLQPEAGSRSSGLSIGAAEFKPSGAAAASLTAGLGSLHLGPAEEQEAPHSAAHGADEGDGSWQYDSWQQDRWQYDGSDVGPAKPEGEAVAGGAAGQAAFLAVLAEQFPLLSEQALHQLFAEQGGSLAATIHTLCSLESEIEGQQHAATTVYGGGPGSAAAALDDGGRQQTAAPAFTADDFPTLGGPAAASSSSRGSNTAGRGAPGGAQYASRARAAAHLPAPPAQRTQGPAGVAVSIGGSGGGGGGTGVSSSAGGVQTVDLHGLHVSEALQQLESLLLRLQGSGGRGRAQQCLRVVVGAGTHGKVPARLPAAVRRYLQEQGLQFSEPYDGLLEIRL